MSTSCPLGIRLQSGRRRWRSAPPSRSRPVRSLFARSTWPHAGSVRGPGYSVRAAGTRGPAPKSRPNQRPMLVEVELFAAGLTQPQRSMAEKVLAAPLVPRFCQQFAGPERPAALARSQRTVQVLLCGLPLRRIGQLAAAEDHRARVGSFGGQNKSARYRKSASGAFSIAN